AVVMRGFSEGGVVRQIGDCPLGEELGKGDGAAGIGQSLQDARDAMLRAADDPAEGLRAAVFLLQVKEKQTGSAVVNQRGIRACLIARSGTLPIARSLRRPGVSRSGCAAVESGRVTSGAIRSVTRIRSARGAPGDPDAPLRERMVIIQPVG